jgi:uncharacterized membrane protein
MAAGSQQLTSVVQKNIDALISARDRYEKQKTLTDHVADAITKWSGSMTFVYLHVIFFAAWIVLNVTWFGFEPFDPFPFGMLTTVVSLEAIFLSTFVLVSQNRQAALSDRRSDLDLQIDLLSEREVTRILQLLDAIAKKLDVEVPVSDVDELACDVGPEEILEELDRRHGLPES